MMSSARQNASIHVQLETYGQTAFSVLDSGCTHSIMPKAFFSRLPEETQKTPTTGHSSSPS